MKKRVDADITPLVPSPDRTGSGPTKSGGIPTPDFYEDRFTYDQRTDTYVCPANRRLKFWTVSETRSPGMRYFVYTTKACLSCKHPED
ncbi:MAG: hypothetical protein JRN15_04945 [Nitrososphaerota archaeon]|nr:hypothetical protein [Nitrososphaerota archaeon]